MVAINKILLPECTGGGCGGETSTCPDRRVHRRNAENRAPVTRNHCRTQPLVNNLYQGMTLDAVTGLYYERNRDYSPSLGRWMEEDPAQFINGANTYQFVDSSPVGNVDAQGLVDAPEPAFEPELPGFRPFGIESGGGGEVTAPGEPVGPGGPEFTPSPGVDAAEGGGSPTGSLSGGGSGEGATEAGSGTGTETPEAPASEPAPAAGTAPADYPSMGELARDPALAKYERVPEILGEPATEYCPASAAERAVPEIRFGTVHAMPHFVGTGVDQSLVENAIQSQLQNELAGATVQGPFTGEINVGGQTKVYRGFGLPNGTVNVGTYYPVKRGKHDGNRN